MFEIMCFFFNFFFFFFFFVGGTENNVDLELWNWLSWKCVKICTLKTFCNTWNWNENEQKLQYAKISSVLFYPTHFFFFFKFCWYLEVTHYKVYKRTECEKGVRSNKQKFQLLLLAVQGQESILKRLCLRVKSKQTIIYFGLPPFPTFTVKNVFVSTIRTMPHVEVPILIW